MKTLIVPCAGRNFINNYPRWALKYSQEDILLSKCIKTLSCDNFDRIVVTLLEDDLIYYSLEKLKRMISPKVEFYIMKQKTSGPAETIYETLINMKIKGSIYIKDIDIIFPYPNKTGNFISGIHILDYESDLKNVKNKSFITVNEKNVVMDIIEKNIKSDIISIGLYGFADANDFIKSYVAISNSFQGERIYVSHIITYLIGGLDKVFEFVEIPEYELFESTKDYERFIRNTGVYLIDSTHVNIMAHFDEIVAISKKGASIVIISSNDLDELLKERMDKNGIKYKLLIVDNSDCIKFIDNDKDMKDVYINAI